MFVVDAFQPPWPPTLGRLSNFGRADVVMVERGASVSVEDVRLVICCTNRLETETCLQKHVYRESFYMLVLIYMYVI